MKRTLTFASFVAFTATASAQVQINEVRIDQPGGDVDEFFELAGPAGASLAGLSYIVIGDGPTGEIEAVIDLGAESLDANGFFVCAESTFSTGTADLTISLNFENSDNVTHLLVDGFTGAVSDNIDADGDGVADNTPWTSVVDGVALVETTDTMASGFEFNYGNLPNTTSVGPDGNFVPGHAYRCGADFLIGDFGGANVTAGAENICGAQTSTFCSPALSNTFAATGSFITVDSASGGSIAANDATLNVFDVPNEFGIFVQSTTTAPAVLLPQGGNLCLGQPLVRLTGALLASGNTVSYTLDFVSGGPETSTMANTTMHYQWWHRDAGGTANLSEGLSVLWID